jgi:CRISPR-associated endonuclease/helicase Cas3
MAEVAPDLLNRFQLDSTAVGAFAALHDLGKISPGFQRKCKIWLEENDLMKIDRNGCWDTGMESNHSKVSHSAIQSFLNEKNIDRSTAKFVSAVLGGHHGRLSPPNDRGYRPQKPMSESFSHIEWDQERMENAHRIWDYFMDGSYSFTMSDESPSLWWLAGLTTVADWIGSNEQFFSPEPDAGNENPSDLARKALDAIGFKRIQFINNLSFHELFHEIEKPEIKWTPNEMQQKTVDKIRGPGVYVIEAPMGMGKTEAALWAAYHLLVSGKSTGIYFALPTQATSNRMHLRMEEFLRRITPEAQNSRLIHGNSWLMDSKYCISPAFTEDKGEISDDARTGRGWFSSTKRALLASFGIGTIDQALLGVVAAKHFFVRHFAFAGKVVILDEVHSYDLYTGTLIDKLITTLESLGCTVIVLSATLTGKRLGQIITLPDDMPEDNELPYPLITGRKEGINIEPTAAELPEPQTIKVEFISFDNAADEAIKLAQNGGAVLWICNTVNTAQKQYQRFRKMIGKEFPIGLLHSRFPYWRREQLEAEWMKRFGKEGRTRCGSILVSTQIVEQSVDLDADLLITELAPTDMLLQRLGRLWRHKRENRPIANPRLLIIKEVKSLDEFRSMEPKAIMKALGGKAHVYAPYILLRSLEVWESQREISILLQVRPLLEMTYKDRGNEPDSWQELSGEWFGTDSAKKMLADRNSNLWQLALEDEEGNQTRINEIQTVSLVLCRSINKEKAVFIDDISSQLCDDTFRLPVAQAIHKNLVKVPEYCFDKDRIDPCSAFADHLSGLQSAGIVADNGAVDVKGLKNGIRFFYSDELGLVIEKKR